MGDELARQASLYLDQMQPKPLLPPSGNDVEAIGCHAHKRILEALSNEGPEERG